MKEFSLIGVVDLRQSTLQVKCVPCEKAIRAEEVGYLYFDELAHQLLLFCAACHQSPSKANDLMYQDSVEDHE